MSARKTLIVAGMFAVAFATATASFAQKPNWNIKLNTTRTPVRAADMTSPLGKDAVSEILLGPTNGNNDGYVIMTRMPQGAHGPAMFTMPDDHLLIVLEGKVNIQIGTDKFVLDRYQGAAIPPNTPHEIWNADPGVAVFMEAVAPGSNRDLLSLVKPAKAAPVANAKDMIRTPKIPAQAELKTGLNGAQFAARKTGSSIQMRIDSTNPGQGGPKPHVHVFTQVYFSIAGGTTVEYGLDTYPLPTYSVVAIQPGVVHTNFNKSNEMERHITLLMPEPKDNSQPFDIEFERKGPAGGATPPAGRGRQ